MKKTDIYRLLPMIIGIFGFGYYYYYSVYCNSKYFVDNAVNTKIIRVYNYANKSLQFYYTDRYCITTSSTSGDTLIIGDSISKKANSPIFNIYRKNKDNGKYKFHKHYEWKNIDLYF
ncbi:MAG: hypothetical protein ACTTJM_08045 [Bergeyella cardium]